ncbi:MAG: hypothetical protein ACK4GC_11975, partial [Paracoccaceae bacterium]
MGVLNNRSFARQALVSELSRAMFKPPCKDMESSIGRWGKASSFDLLFPYGFSCDSDDTEPGHRKQVDGK